MQQVQIKLNCVAPSQQAPLSVSHISQKPLGGIVSADSCVSSTSRSMGFCVSEAEGFVCFRRFFFFLFYLCLAWCAVFYENSVTIVTKALEETLERFHLPFKINGRQRVASQFLKSTKVNMSMCSKPCGFVVPAAPCLQGGVLLFDFPSLRAIATLNSDRKTASPGKGADRYVIGYAPAWWQSRSAWNQHPENLLNTSRRSLKEIETGPKLSQKPFEMNSCGLHLGS